MKTKVYNLAIPAALKQLMDIAQILVDMIMVGTLGVAAIAAVGLSLQLMMIIQAVMSLHMVGTSAVLTRYIGSRRVKRASVVAYVSLWITLLSSVITGLIGFIFVEDFFSIMHSTHEVSSLGISYVTILCFGMPLIFLDSLGNTILSASGDTKRPLLIKIAASVLNVILNYIFIFGHMGIEPMGVAGAAYATVISYVISLILYAWILFSAKEGISLAPIFSKIDALKIIRVGIPAAFERLFGVLSFMLFVVIIASYGTESLAGYQIGLRIEALAFMPGFGFSVAAMVLVGQYIGAKQLQKAYEAGRISMKIALIFMGTMGVILFLFPHFFIEWFTQDSRSIESAKQYLQLVGIAQLPLALTFVMSGALRGAGATKLTLKISMFSLWVFRIIPSYFVMKMGGGLLGVYIVMTIETFIKGIWFWYIFERKEWLKIEI